MVRHFAGYVHIWRWVSNCCCTNATDTTINKNGASVHVCLFDQYFFYICSLDIQVFLFMFIYQKVKNIQNGLNLKQHTFSSLGFLKGKHCSILAGK